MKSAPALNINGILLLDKPLNLTSNQALQKVKRIYNARKAGHTGSLDPLASGMLPICFGEATKFCQFLLAADKKYLVTAELGKKTTTGDAEGEVVATRDIPAISEADLIELLKKFTGTITQVPSMYSALKHNGQPLYALARKGIEVERKAREVNIYNLELQHFDGKYLTLAVYCSKGTYVRTLIEDIGEALNCGAYVTALRREAVAPYFNAPMVTLEQLQNTTGTELKQYLLPVDSAIADWQEIKLTEAAAFYLRRGQPVIIPHAPTSGWIKLSLQNGHFLGVGEILSDGRVAPRRLVEHS